MCDMDTQITLAQAIESFFQDFIARGLSKNTRQRYQDELRDFTKFLNGKGKTELHTVTKEDLRAYIAELLTRTHRHHPDQTLSPHTADGHYRTIKAFFTWCTADGLLDRNPMLNVRHPELPIRLVPRLSEEQVAKLLGLIEQTKSPQRNLAMIMLMVGCGLRRGEVLGLRVEDVDLQVGKVTVIGKGDKEREIPTGVIVTQALRAWLLVRPPCTSDKVFIHAGMDQLEKNAIQSLFRRLRKGLGVKRLYPHLLRHTFAKMYLKCADAKSLQQILGHAKASTTLDLYVSFDFDDLKQIYERVSPIDAIVKCRERHGAEARV